MKLMNNKTSKRNMKNTTFAIWCICLMIALACGKSEKPKSHISKIKLSKCYECLYSCDTISLNRATTYNPTVSQCDSDPLTTADGSKIDIEKLRKKEIRWVALSRDLIYDEERQCIFKDTTHWRGDFLFNDTIEIYSEKFPHLNGDWIVHDCMSPDYKMSIDFLISPENNYPKLGVGTDVKIIWCP